MKYLLTIADGLKLDIYAIDDQHTLKKHWSLGSLEVIAYNELIRGLCDHVSWEPDDFQELACILSTSDSDAKVIKAYLRPARVVDIKDLASFLGCGDDTILIETRERFLAIGADGCKPMQKSDVYDIPVAMLTSTADKRFRSIGCIELEKTRQPYDNTKRFFMNLFEHMPVKFDTIFVPVFAVSGPNLPLSDKGFVELSWNDMSEEIFGQIEAALREALPCDIEKIGHKWIYNALLKKKLFK